MATASDSRRELGSLNLLKPITYNGRKMSIESKWSILYAKVLINEIGDGISLIENEWLLQKHEQL